MGDAALSEFMCNADWALSTLVDGTYPRRPQFIKPDGSEEHAEARVCAEHMFGRNKSDWWMTGQIYRRESRFHNLCIRATFILSNMKLKYRMWKAAQ